MYSIFTYIWAIYGVNNGKYSSTMEHMGCRRTYLWFPGKKKHGEERNDPSRWSSISSSSACLGARWVPYIQLNPAMRWILTGKWWRIWANSWKKEHVISLYLGHNMKVDSHECTLSLVVGHYSWLRFKSHCWFSKKCLRSLFRAIDPLSFKLCFELLCPA